MPADELLDPEYLGDGVMVAHDNSHIVLWLDNCECAHGLGRIALEPAVMRRLNDYWLAVQRGGRGDA